MFGIGDEFFVRFVKESPKRVLHPAKVVGSDDGSFVAEFEDSGLSAEADQSIVLYYNVKRKFVQQPAHIISVEENEPKLVVTIKTVGEYASAEGREYYRVSTVLSDLTVDVVNEGTCDLLDVSATGFAIASQESYGIGQLLGISVTVEDEDYRGRACIQSIKVLPNGSTRYGLLCITEDETKDTLRRGLSRLCMVVQRQQLQRLSGMA